MPGRRARGVAQSAGAQQSIAAIPFAGKIMTHSPSLLVAWAAPQPKGSCVFPQMQYTSHPLPKQILAGNSDSMYKFYTPG
jgi:hypothetical protein